MSIIEAVLVYAGIPLAVILLVYGFVYAGSAARRGKRYRPGRPFEFRPVWFLSAPDQFGNGGSARTALEAGDAPVALPAGAPGDAPEGHGTTGGASDVW